MEYWNKMYNFISFEGMNSYNEIFCEHLNIYESNRVILVNISKEFPNHIDVILQRFKFKWLWQCPFKDSDESWNNSLRRQEKEALGSWLAVIVIVACI